MLLPNKHRKLEYTLLALGALVLPHVGRGTTVSNLWKNAKMYSGMTVSYENFILTLDFLYASGLIDLHRGLIVKVSP